MKTQITVLITVAVMTAGFLFVSPSKLGHMLGQKEDVYVDGNPEAPADTPPWEREWLKNPSPERIADIQKTSEIRRGIARIDAAIAQRTHEMEKEEANDRARAIIDAIDEQTTTQIIYSNH